MKIKKLKKKKQHISDSFTTPLDRLSVFVQWHKG